MEFVFLCLRGGLFGFEGVGGGGILKKKAACGILKASTKIILDNLIISTGKEISALWYHCLSVGGNNSCTKQIPPPPPR